MAWNPASVFLVFVFSLLIPGVQCLNDLIDRRPSIDPGTEVVAAVGAATAAAGAVVAAPAVLTAAGFTTAGVAAGSLAAWIQTPATAAGSWFALSQSAGVLGLAGTTKAVVGGVAGGITYVASLFF